MADYAILIPWVKTDSGETLLLEVRSKYVRQPGEICFPGGRAEPGESAVDAAVRETCEELGVAPEDIEVISELEPLTMGDGRRVYPIEARLNIDGVEKLELSEREVADVFLLPRKWLEENSFAHYDLAETPDEELPERLHGYLSGYAEYRTSGSTDYIEYEDHGIWGLTARIIKSLDIWGLTARIIKSLDI